MGKATSPKISVSVCPRASPDSTLPASTPASIGHIQRLSSSQSTAPFLLWARSDEIEVGMMVASEVPTATCIRKSSGTCMTAST